MGSEIPIDDNPVTEKRKRIDGALVIERTHEKPVTHVETHVITDLKKQITKYQGVIDVWQARIDALQKIVDEYDDLKEEKK